MEAAHAGQPAVGSPALRCTYSATSGCGRIRKRSAARPATTASATSSGSIAPCGEHDLAVRSRRAEEHVGAHALRAQARHLDACVAVGDRQPLGEPDGRVLGGGVRALPMLVSRPAADAVLQQVALAPGEHRRQHRPRRVHVGHHVDVPDASPRRRRVPRRRRRWPMPALEQNRSIGPKRARRLVDDVSCTSASTATSAVDRDGSCARDRSRRRRPPRRPRRGRRR